MADWLRLGLIVAAGVGGCAAIEQTALYPPPKRGIQIAIALAVGVVVLRFVGLV